MKHCNGCDQDKPETEFWKGQGRCKQCRREYDRQRYQTHYKAKRRKTEDAWRKRELEYVWEIKTRTPCADCGSGFHPAAMQFDHLPGFTKEGDVSSMIGSVSRQRLDAEIAKCELVCANCHSIRTYTRLLSDNG